MPFLNRAGFVGEVEPFDFAVEGVTAISCDIVGLDSEDGIRTLTCFSTNTRFVQKVSTSDFTSTLTDWQARR